MRWRSLLVGAAFAASVLSSVLAASAKPRAVTLVDGWHCGSCANRTARLVRDHSGVTAASADADRKALSVTFDDQKVTVTDICKIIHEAGFRCR